ncbi:aldolase/citrate lyase family protein [Propylenella binzhouense]|uniref:HpcH/HpaI aldolase/citrate lyase domain-containing protein n=1 Tax=Propylenella binzhouense TaxID=2555902 RepID=A0A964WS00_9HYPH|nr:aldolase/citrate lyase family protein [Propylenella binzhouense]MYZ46325.1 hypothetical protein [Propylenella binzhouense]
MGGSLNFTAALFLPADRPERFGKATAAGADAAILDLEDAVAADAKGAGRAALRSDLAFVPVRARVNGLGTPWHAAHMAARAGRGLAAVIVPKAEAGAAFTALCETAPVPVIAWPVSSDYRRRPEWPGPASAAVSPSRARERTISCAGAAPTGT